MRINVRKRDFQGHAMFNFPHVDPNPDILFEKLTAQIGGCNWKIPSAHYPSGFEDFVQSLSSFLIFLVVTCTFMP